MQNLQMRHKRFFSFLLCLLCALALLPAAAQAADTLAVYAGRDQLYPLDSGKTNDVGYLGFPSLRSSLKPGLPEIQQELLDKHYLRKRGKNAYYGQRARSEP